MTDASASGRTNDPLCAYCGREVPALAAMIYHGVVYHPACLEPTTRRTPSPRGDDGPARSSPPRRP